MIVGGVKLAAGGAAANATGLREKGAQTVYLIDFQSIT